MPANSSLSKDVIAQSLLPSLLINLLTLAVPLTVLQIYDRILPNQSYGTASLLITGAVLAVLMEGLLRFVRSWILAAAASNTEKTTFRSVVERISYASSQDIQKLGLGGVHEGIDAVTRAKEWNSGGVLAGFIDLPFALIFLGLVGYIGGELVLVPVVVWLLTIGVVWFASSNVRLLGQRAAVNEMERKTFLSLLVVTVQGVKRQAVESRVYSQFKRLNQAKYLSKAEEEKQNAFAQECIQLAALGTSVILVITGSVWVLNGELTTGGLAACSILSGRAISPLSALVGIQVKLNSMQTAKSAIKNIELMEPILNAPVSDVEFESLKIESASTRFLNGVYQTKGEIEKGDIVLLQSKERYVDSKMLSSLAGIDAVIEDHVYLNGERSSISSAMANSRYCGSKGQLIAGSVLDNLCNFDPNAIDKVSHFTHSLGLDAAITKLPDGLETQIGHSGSAPFSMGYIKLANLVASFTSSSQVVLLDRPDSSLDMDAMEKLAQTILNESEKGRTILLVSYHPKLTALANKTLCVESIVQETGDAV
ncbi:ABC transporter transmembrane domain-containing protein [Vibrio tapetis]|uniref:ABC transporter protein n=1 Tax=Vibrio tapetis subsp. tapetis TaxID=1671868 RepID=A0A2N8ZM40_9VIBR|nr:ABC transporter transmembrane domain-containing protein [Vibrio tapetis]SON52975.1 ABC transporter protein [Vibrio tapetis subsp. tapetis]